MKKFLFSYLSLLCLSFLFTSFSPSDSLIEKNTVIEASQCIPVPLGYHRGGNTTHDRVADTKPPNDRDPSGRLGDWELGGKAFDAYVKSKKELWEVKTTNFETYSDFVKDMELKKQVEEIKIEYAIANNCGFKYVFATTSKENYDLVRNDARLAGLNVIYKLV